MSRKGAFFSPGKKPFFSFGRKKEAEPEIVETDSLSQANHQAVAPVVPPTSSDFSTRTIGGVPMDWPDESTPADSSGAWQPSPAVPWAAPATNLPKPSAVFDPAAAEAPHDWAGSAPPVARQEPVKDEPALHLPFAQNGSPLPEGRETVASFQPDGSHDVVSVWGSAAGSLSDDVSQKVTADGGSFFTPQPIRTQPPAAQSIPPVELQLVQGSMPVIPDWEPGIPVPLREEPKTDSCLPTSDIAADPANAAEPVADESAFTWDQILVKKEELPGIAAALSDTAAPEPVKTTPPPAWGAPAWGRPRLAKDPEPVQPAPAVEQPAAWSEPVVEAPVSAQAVVEEIRPEPFAWPEPTAAVSPAAVPEATVPPVNLEPEPFAWPEPVMETPANAEPVADIAAFTPAAIPQPEPFAWPDPAVEPNVSFAEVPLAESSLPPVLTEPEAIAWPTIKEEANEWPVAPAEPFVEAAAAPVVEAPVEPPPAFAWPEPVMELPPVSVLEPDLEDLPPLDLYGAPSSPAEPVAPEALLSIPTPPPVAEAAVVIDPVAFVESAAVEIPEAAPSDSIEETSELERPSTWDGSGDTPAAAETSAPVIEAPEQVGQWQEEEVAVETAPVKEEASQTWGLPSTWMSEPVLPPGAEAAKDERWVSAEEDEKPEPAPVPAAKAAPTIDPEKEIEKSLERLFSLNRSFRWKRVGELLQELGLVSEADLAEALKHQKETKKPLGKTLVDMGIISDRLLLKVLAAQKDVIPWYFDDALDPDLLALLDPEFCLRCQVLPVRQQGATLTLVMRNPSDVDTIDFVQHTTGLRVEPALGEEETLSRKIDEAFSRDARSHRAHVDALVQEAFKSSDIRVSHIDENKTATAIEEETRPVSAIVQKLIAEAIKMRASDIHMEPTMHDLQIRYRIDGRLHKVNSVPKEIQPMIAARVKIMAELDPVEWRIPQDGRISFEIDRRVVDLRVSVLPSFYGSRIVMRLLDRSAGVKNLDDIGFSPSNLSIFKTLIKRPYGLFLVTGPTGSGKTTSLYAALNEVKDEETNIITCEDPVEYNLDGISQSQVNTKIGLTFAAQLRSILRQDPDVVLVGEIRDHETAETAIRASMTGHLVFSTLHCNDAPSAIPRLLDMNIDPFLLSTSLIGVMGQRLIRRICPECGHEYKPTDDEKVILERTFGLIGVDKLFKGAGCVRCAYTGFKGRFAVHEIMPVTQEISSYIADRASTEKLGEVSRFYGYRTMQEDTLERVLAGQTTLKEAQRLLAFDDIPRIDPTAKKK